MPSFARRTLAFLALAAATCNASALPRAELDTSAFADCAGGVSVSTSQIVVGDITVDRETIYCVPPTSLGERINLVKPIPSSTKAPVTTSSNKVSITSAIPTTVSSSAPVSTTSAAPVVGPRRVCGQSCTSSCNNNAGVLPPITEDCASIYSALVLFGQSSVPSFVTHPNSVEQFTVGTCRVFFQNTGTQDLEYCWIDLKIAASSAGSFCFPPVQPFTSQGQCGSFDGAWFAGVAHS